MRFVTDNIRMYDFANLPIVVTIKDSKLLRSVRGNKDKVQTGCSYFALLGYVMPHVVSIQLFFNQCDLSDYYLFYIFAKNYESALDARLLTFLDDNIPTMKVVKDYND